MNLNEILEREEQILEKAKELGFLESVKIYNGPKDMLYLIVEHDKSGVCKSAQKCSGLKCEITDLLKCQVVIINASQISKGNEYEFLKKSALLTDRNGLQRAFGTEHLEEVEIDSPDAEYEYNMEDFRDIYEDFKKELLLQRKEKGEETIEKGVNKLKIRPTPYGRNANV